MSMSRKGNEALARKDLQTAKAEFRLAMCESNPIIQRIVKNRLMEIEDRELSESKTTADHIKTIGSLYPLPLAQPEGSPKWKISRTGREKGG